MSRLFGKGRLLKLAFSLISFAKFLEILFHSSTIHTLQPELCEHTTPPPRPRLAADHPQPRSRLNIHRHFKIQSTTLTFTLSMIEEIFELRVPRLQLMRSRAGEKAAQHSPRGSIFDEIKEQGDEEKKVLRREIRAWFQSVSEHIDKLVGFASFSRVFQLTLVAGK